MRIIREETFIENAIKGKKKTKTRKEKKKKDRFNKKVRQVNSTLTGKKVGEGNKGEARTWGHFRGPPNINSRWTTCRNLG